MMEKQTGGGGEVDNTGIGGWDRTMRMPGGMLTRFAEAEIQTRGDRDEDNLTRRDEHIEGSGGDTKRMRDEQTDCKREQVCEEMNIIMT